MLSLLRTRFSTATSQRIVLSVMHSLQPGFISGDRRKVSAANMASVSESEVLHERHDDVGLAILNRPKALNSLNTNMVELLYDLYANAPPDIACIVLKGAGQKAFCAGGDVKTIVQLGQAGKFEEALRFFNSEYKLNYLISQLQRPHVALLDGITMGGGVGVSVHGTFRVATEKTMFAMPECAIGLFPDVGGSYFLPRLPGTLGLYLALTGARLTGATVKHARIATHYIPSSLLPELQESIADLGPAARDAETLGRLLDSFERREPVPHGALPDILTQVERLFSGRGSVEEIYAACEADGSQFARETLQLMAKGSPMSQKLTYEQLRRGAEMDLGECLRMEMRMVHECVMRQGCDFYRGVTAALIDRSGPPSWDPPTLEQVQAEDVLKFFQPIPEGHELQLPALPPGPQARL